jgi:hypothetical protein
MENSPASKYASSFGLSLAFCAVLNAVLVVAKESSKSVADWMQKITGHHWVIHVVITFVLFVAFGSFFSRKNGGQGPAISFNRLTTVVFTGVLAGVLIVLGFYLIAD